MARALDSNRFPSIHLCICGKLKKPTSKKKRTSGSKRRYRPHPNNDKHTSRIDDFWMEMSHLTALVRKVRSKRARRANDGGTGNARYPTTMASGHSFSRPFELLTPEQRFRSKIGKMYGTSRKFRARSRTEVEKHFQRTVVFSKSGRPTSFNIVAHAPVISARY